MAGQAPCQFQPAKRPSGWQRSEASVLVASQPQHGSVSLPTPLLAQTDPVRLAVSATALQQVPTALQPFSEMPPRKLRRNISVIHGTLLWGVLMPPFILCLNLLCNADFRYFVGALPLFSVWIMLFACVVPVIDYTLRPSSWWFLFSALLPMLAFCILGEFCRQGAANVRSALDNRDCMGFGEKRNLQKAYLDATALLHECVQSHQSFADLSFENCAGYQELEQDWHKEFAYLKRLETEHPCSGICHEGVRLWDMPGKQAPSCSLYVSNWIYGGHLQCKIIFGYSFLMLFAVWIMYDSLKNTLDSHWVYACSEKK